MTTAAGAVDLDASHLAVPGDFNADGRLDVLLQPLTKADKGALVLQDGTGDLSILAQGWDPDYLGLDWSAGASTLSTADLNGDGQADVIVQPVKPGKTGAILITGPTVQLLSVNQLLPAGYLGLDWSSTASTLISGDFDGDRHQELFLQSVKRTGTGALVHADAEGHLIGIYQSFPDKYLGRHWSAADETFYVGDFNGDGRQDLLAQSKLGGRGESAYALLLADGNGRFTQLNETWNAKDLGADWDPATHAIVIEDANGDGIMDITLRSRTGGTNYLFEGNTQGTFRDSAVNWTGTKSASDALADKAAKDGKKNGTGTKTGIIGMGSNGPTAKTITAPNDPEQDPVVSRGGSGSNDPIMTPNAVGAMAGSGGVSGGTATYSIPISVPPGIAGMQPAVSLNYSSRGGNGEVGMGWSLGAGSQIHRCPATGAMDTYSTGLTYGNDDRLCLDGQHLVLYSGAYGYSGAVYRTELDSFTRITQSGGGFGSTASYFTVERKDGRIQIYGNTADSVFVPGSQTKPLAWGLNREKDQYGNTINYHYTQYGTGEYLLTSIDYTGSGNTAGNREVDFGYTTRADVTGQYLAGGQTMQTKLLSTITTKQKSSVVTTYTLEYTTSAATGRSLLAGVQQCGGSGTGKLCLPETTFSWHAPTTHFDSPLGYGTEDFDQRLGVNDDYTTTQLQNPSITSPGDFDGDGRRELLYHRDGDGTQLLFVDASGNEINHLDLDSLLGGTYPIFADADNDGAMDLISTIDGGSGGAHWLAYSRFDGTAAAPAFGTPVNMHIQMTQDSNGVPTSSVVQLADFNGDGKLDVVVAYWSSGVPATYKYYQNITGPSDTSPQFANPVAVYTGSAGVSMTPDGDLDGNGLPDFKVGIYQSYANHIAGQQTQGWIFTTLASDHTVQFQYVAVSGLGVNGDAVDLRDDGMEMDVNGDGLPDLVYHCASSANWCYQLDTGAIGTAMFAAQVDTGVVDNRNAHNSNASVNTLVGDTDNDGHEELLYPDTLLSEFCADEMVNIGQNQWAREAVCAFHGYGGQTLPASQDYSIYKYRKVEFLPQAATGIAGGYKYAPVDSASDIIAQSRLAVAMDLQGDGLMDVISPFSKEFEYAHFEDVTNPPTGYVRPHGLSVVYNSATSAGDSGKSKNAASDLMLSAVDGFGVTTAWDYYPLSSDYAIHNVRLYYVPGPDSPGRYDSPDYFYFSSSMYVVGDYSVSDGLGGTRQHDFHYSQAIYNNQGRGFQGFRTVVDDDEGTNARTVQIYHQHFPLSGELQESWTQPQSDGFTITNPTIGASKVNHVQNTWGCMQGQDTGVPQMQADGVACDRMLGASTYVPVLLKSIQDTYDPASHDQLTHNATSYCAHPDQSGLCAPDDGYDHYGNLLASKSTLDDAAGTYISTVSYDFDTSDLTDWWIDKLMSKTIVVDADYTRGGGANPGPVTRETDYDYRGDGTHALYHTYARADGAAANLVTTQYTFNRGNLTGVTVSGGLSAPDLSHIDARTTTTTYSTGTDADYFVATVTDAMGHVTQSSVDARFGSLQEVIDPNGVTTDTAYDVLGRKTSVQLTAPISIPAQAIQYLPYTSGDGMCDGMSTTAIVKYYVLVNQTGYPSHYICYDMLGRAVRTNTESFSSAGDLVYQRTDYDDLGRVTRVSEPYFAGITPIWNTNSYDDANIAGRLASHTDAKGVVTTYAYDQETGTGGYDPLVTKITTTTPNDTLNSSYSRVDREEKNSLGKLLKVTNALGAAEEAGTTYTYDSDGNPVTITAADGTQIIAQYDVLGHKYDVMDPDQGHTTYAYDVLGELRQQVDAKGQTLTMTYDLLGRMVTKSSSVSGEHTVSWLYDGNNIACGDSANTTVAPYIGQLRCVVRGTTTDTDYYRQNYMYDSDGRANHVRDMIGGNTYDTDTTFDADGRVDTVTYPDSVSDYAPVANAGSHQYVLPGAIVTLSGSATDADNGPEAPRYQWAQTAGPSVTLSGSTTATPGFTAGTALGTTYSFLLTADDGLFAGTDTVSVTVPNVPGAVTGLTVGTDPDNDGNYNVVWDSLSVAGTTIKYHVEEAFTDTSTAPASSAYSEVGVVTGTTYAASHTGNSHYYYWYRVRAEDFIGNTSIGLGSYSSVGNVHLVVAPGAPTSISPTSGSALVNQNYTISWGAYTGPIAASKVFYELYMSTSSTFTSQSLVYSGTSRSVVTSQATAAFYYYRVRACNQDGSKKSCSDYTSGGQEHVITGGGGGGGLVMPPNLSEPGDTSGGLDRFATIEGAAISTQMDLPVESPHAAVSGVRPEFDKPVYQAYADAHVVNATGTPQIARLSVKYIYTSNGYLWQLADAIDTTRVFWQVDKTVGTGTEANGNHFEYGMDARGHITHAQFGTSLKTHYTYEADTGYLSHIYSSAGSTVYQDLGYNWFKTGNLQQRSSTITVSGTTYNPSESFQYDLHNRLKQSKVSNASGDHYTTMAYNSVGNLACKSDVVGHDCVADPTGYTYGGVNGGPHALTNAGGIGYSYDADGNMSVRNSGTISWSSDNLPTSIIADASDVSTFKYAPDTHRYNQVATTSGSVINTTYVGGYQLDNTNNNASIKYSHYLTAYGRPVMRETLSNDNNTLTEDKEYVLTDHLGGVDTEVSDSSSAGSNQSFDVFGKRRDKTTWQTGTSKVDTRGFTSQEHLDNVGLIHMNGRVYDPAIGRFMSVDPVYQAPTNSQSVNPYSYVMNNPLSLVDPSGYCAATSADEDSYNTVTCGKGDDSGNGTYNGRNSGNNNGRQTGSGIGGVTTGISGGDVTTIQNQRQARENQAAVLFGGANLFGGGIFSGSGSFGNGNNNSNQNMTVPGENGGGDANQGAPNQRKNTGDAGDRARSAWDVISSAIAPETVALGSHGESGSLLDNLKGAGEQLVNTVSGLANLMVGAPGPVGAARMAMGVEFPQLHIANSGLLGASIVELGTFFIGGGEAKATEGAESAVYVIGRLPDTAVARNWSGHIVQNIPKSEWSISRNDEWVQNIIETRSRVYTASPLTHENLWDPVFDRPRVYARELNQFFDAGYTKQGDYLVPPH